MNSRQISWHLLWIGIASVLAISTDAKTTIDENVFAPEQLDFFEDRIRPLLTRHCLECHGPQKSESELRLDSRDAILAGGSSGNAGAVAGEPDTSLIVQAVRHAGDFEMPPNRKLSENEIADLVRWVEMKLPWPKSAATISPFSIEELIQQHRRNHWAFQPIRRPAAPPVQSRAVSAVDRFVLAKLESIGLSLSPRADRRTLIRRATFDLTGLPPTYSQVESFVNNDSPNAYSELVDRLLDSPQYGERWARHWLDVARYSDTSGYALGNADNRYPFAFTYRDYVIDAFNSDLPYDQFIREQLAADHLDVPGDKKTLAALGFITVGRKYLGRPETVDDQVDVVTRGLMGLTVSCARCHDHKYDAIPTQDYYSLYSVFANNHVPDELPLIGSDQQRARFESYFQELNELKNRIVTFRQSKHQALRQHIDEHFPDYLALVIAPEQELLIEKQAFIQLKAADIRTGVLDQWRNYLRKNHDDPALIKPSLDLLAIADDQFELNAAVLIDHWSNHPDETRINVLYLEKLKSNPPIQKIELARILGELFSETLEEWKSRGSKEPPIGQFDGPRREIAAILFDNRSPARISLDKFDKYMELPERQELEKLQAAIVKHNAESPAGLARAMVLRDNEQLNEQHIMLRGNEHQRGDIVPRRFVALLSREDPEGLNERPIFERQSGRLDLAEKIASRENPLTARVLVNRVWMHHFSRPLVDTPSDFGIRCEQPVQLDLLNFLAAEFIDNGWSVKQLHRSIMLSDTYCQASDERSDCVARDSENRLLWKMNRRRLEFEPLRDSMLAVSGQLDLTLYGKSVELFKPPLSNRRTIYGLINRQDLPGLYRVFDLANPDQSTARRIRTTVPQQALFMMNSLFVTQQARHLVDAIPDFSNTGVPAKLTWLYHAIYQRDPTSEELEIGRQFIDSSSPRTGEKNLGIWQRYAQLLLCTNEFEFID